MFGDIIQPTHLIFILVVALIVLGPKRLPEVGRSLGRGLRDFRQGMQGVEEEARSVFRDAIDEPEQPTTAPAAPAVPATPESVAELGDQIGLASPDLAPVPSAAPVATPVAAEPEPVGLRRLTSESPEAETAALVALLREGGRAWARYVVAARTSGTECALAARRARAGARAALL